MKQAAAAVGLCLLLALICLAAALLQGCLLISKQAIQATCVRCECSAMDRVTKLCTQFRCKPEECK